MIRYANAASSDLPAIAELYQSAFPEALLSVFGKSRLPSAAVTDVLRGLRRHDPSGFIVAWNEDTMAGFIFVTPNRRRLAKALLLKGTLATLILKWMTGRYRGLGLRFIPRLVGLCWDYWRSDQAPGADDPEMAQILSIVVASDVRRQGIGRRLTELALAYLRTTPARWIRLEVDAAKSAPLRLYQQVGFKEISRLPTLRGPARVMTLQLRS